MRTSAPRSSRSPSNPQPSQPSVLPFAGALPETHPTDAIFFFAAIGVIGMSAQWLAWRFRIPAIVILLAAGLILGPATGWLIPSVVLGPMVRPMVSAAVAIILFEGGLSLDFRGLRGATQAVG